MKYDLGKFTFDIEAIPSYSWEFCYEQALKFARMHRCRCRVYKHDRLGWMWGQIVEER